MTMTKSFKFLFGFLLACVLVALAFSFLIGQSIAAPDVRTVQADVVNWKPVTLAASGAMTVTPNLSQTSVFLLSPTSTMTLTLSTTGALPGDMVLLVGSVATTTNLVDTGATGTGAARDIADTDVWFGVFNGSKWSEVSFVNNQ